MRSERVRGREHGQSPIAVGYQAGGVLGLLLGGFLADTWLWFAVIVLAAVAGGLLAGGLADIVMSRLSQRQSI